MVVAAFAVDDIQLLLLLLLLLLLMPVPWKLLKRQQIIFIDRLYANESLLRYSWANINLWTISFHYYYYFGLTVYKSFYARTANSMFAHTHTRRHRMWMEESECNSILTIHHNKFPRQNLILRTGYRTTCKAKMPKSIHLLHICISCILA